MNYETDENILKKYFGCFGEIKRIRLVKCVKTNKSKGYAFIEYRDKRSAEVAYNQANGRNIDDHKVIVDMELGRTDKYWYPTRLGGGRGAETRRNKDEGVYIKEIKKEMKN